MSLLLGLVGYSKSVNARREALTTRAEQACGQRYEETCDGNMADIRSAAASEDMVDLAVWQIVTGLAGLILIGWTLSATRAAVREANEATAAAREAVSVTEKNNRRELRAYLGCELQTWGLSPGKPHAGFILVNHGLTPAKDVQLRGDIKALPFPLGLDFPLEVPEAAINVSGPCFPGRHPDPAKQPLSRIAGSEIIPELFLLGGFSTNSIIRFYMYGTIGYRDVFNESHNTDFCLMLDPGSLTRDDDGNIVAAIWSPVEGRNDMT